MGNMSQLKALPRDGKPINTFDDEDTAWLQVYEGLKRLLEALSETFTVKPEFRKEMEETEFISQEHLSLQSMFVFPNLSLYTTSDDVANIEKKIKNTHQLLQNKYTLIHGDELSGKTALCRHLFLSLLDDNKPVIYVDLSTIGRKASPDVFRDVYQDEFNGDYSLWEEQPDKIILLDNLSSEPHVIQHVLLAMKQFEQVVVTLSSDIFYAYFRDDEGLAQFCEVRILPFTHNKQQKLIQKRLELSGLPVIDGRVDEIENQVNDVIISNRILPRYPFYVLTILQTYEGFMPSDLSVTSYGHCYYVLIIAHLTKSGIPNLDDEINACLNFLENLAFVIYNSDSSKHYINSNSFDEFVEEYKAQYLIKESTLHRLFNQDYGIVKRTNQFEKSPIYQFKSRYMYYYFLGKMLAKNGKKHQELIEGMVAQSYIASNCLTLIFIIHHTSDDEIIDDILLRTICALDHVKPSELHRQEAKIFDEIVAAIPSQVLSDNTVEFEREKERDKRDRRELNEQSEIDNEEEKESHHYVNDTYRIMKNSEI